MRIAQIAPLHEAVPPRGYGGTERVISYLTEQLVAQGHEVTLFAAGDSVTTATLIPVVPQSLRSDSRCRDTLAHHVRLLALVLSEADQFDVIHCHCDYLHFPMTRAAALNTITTLHGRLDLPDLLPLYREFNDIPLVSVSRAQRFPLPTVRWEGNVYHGIPRDLYQLVDRPGGHYLAVVGRIAPERGIDRAIEIALRLGIELRIGARVEPADQDYFDQVIRPLLRRPGIVYLGEITDREKQELLGGALAMLFPIDWPDPFGLVMVEAMACGTPVIGFRRGAVPEIVDPGVTGYVVENIPAACDAVKRVGGLSRRRCRAAFELRFGADRMAADYLALYQRLAPPRGFDEAVGRREPEGIG